jgi:hypothetical protein
VKITGASMKITKRQLRQIIKEAYEDRFTAGAVNMGLDLRKDLGKLSMTYVRMGLDRDEVAGILRDVADGVER